MSRASDALTRLGVFEYRLCVLLNGGSRHRQIRSLFALVSWLGDGKFWYGLMLALPLTKGFEAGACSALQMALTAAIAVALYKCLKHGTNRERPFVAHPGIACAVAPLDRYSFPSGHTLHAVCLTMLATEHHPELALVLAPFTVLVMLSRVVLGLHYPTDVLAGAAIGWLLAEASLLVFSG